MLLIFIFCHVFGDIVELSANRTMGDAVNTAINDEANSNVAAVVDDGEPFDMVSTIEGVEYSEPIVTSYNFVPLYGEISKRNIEWDGRQNKAIVLYSSAGSPMAVALDSVIFRELPSNAGPYIEQFEFEQLCTPTTDEARQALDELKSSSWEKRREVKGSKSGSPIASDPNGIASIGSTYGYAWEDAHLDVIEDASDTGSYCALTDRGRKLMLTVVYAPRKQLSGIVAKGGLVDVRDTLVGDMFKRWNPEWDGRITLGMSSDFSWNSEATGASSPSAKKSIPQMSDGGTK